MLKLPYLISIKTDQCK